MNTRRISQHSWAANWKFTASGKNPSEEFQRIATHGHCPICGRLYEVKLNGTLRKHSTTPDCYLKPQLPAEIIPAILLLAELE